jgi:hypothetical protein
MESIRSEQIERERKAFAATTQKQNGSSRQSSEFPSFSQTRSSTRSGAGEFRC